WRTSRCATRRRAGCRAQSPARAAYARRRNRAPRPTPHARARRSEYPCEWRPWQISPWTALSSTHRLDIVAVGVDQERRVIGRAVIGARARRPVVAAAGLDALRVEFLDGGMIGRAKRDMRAGAFETVLRMEPQRGLALRAEPCAVLVLRAKHVAERRQ